MPAIFTKDAPGFGPDREGGAARVIDDNGKKGDANKAVIDALIERNMLFARGRLKHQYPHRWRSKKPVIFRNTPQWFVHMDKELGGFGLDAASTSPLRGRSSPKATGVGVSVEHRHTPTALTAPSPQGGGGTVATPTPCAPARLPPSTPRASCRRPGRRGCAP